MQTERKCDSNRVRGSEGQADRNHSIVVGIIMTNPLKISFAHQVSDALFTSSEEIIEREDVLTVLYNPVTQITPEKSGPTRYKYSLLKLFYAARFLVT